MNDFSKAKGHLAIFAANAIFGLGVPVTKALLDDWVTPMGYMASRCVFAAVIFWVIAYFMPKEPVEKRDLVVIMLAGLLGFVISQTLTAWALDFTTPVYYSLVAAMTPVAVMILAAIFLKENITAVKIVGVLLAIAGALLMLFISWQSGTGKNDLLGIFLTVLSMLTWAVYLIVTRKVSAKYSSVTQMKYVFLVSAIVTLPIALFTEPQQRLYSSAWEWSGVIEMAFIVLFATVLGYFLIPYGQKRIRPTLVSMYSYLQPIIATVISIVTGLDILTWQKLLATILVFAGVWLVIRSRAAA